MKRQTLLKAWAVFGLYWFVTLVVLRFSTVDLPPILIIAAISIYIGIILTLISVASLIYERMKSALKRPVEVKKEEIKQ